VYGAGLTYFYQLFQIGTRREHGFLFICGFSMTVKYVFLLQCLFMGTENFDQFILA
jgi:hypothetical protein